MKKARAAFGVALLAVPACAEAQYLYIPIYIPGRHDVWSVKSGIPYAVWNTRATPPGGTEVAVTKPNMVVDAAPLFPQALYATDEDLKEGGKVWLPKGGLLIKMAGGEGDWLCTWRFDTQSTSNISEPLIRKGAETELCLRINASGKTFSPKLAQAIYAKMMTVAFFGTRVGQNEIEQTNSVGVSAVDPGALPSRLNLEVIARPDKSSSVCLQLRLTDLTSSPKCLMAVGDTVSLAGGSYTLVSFNGKKDFRIRVNAPLNVQNLAPKIVK